VITEEFGSFVMEKSTLKVVFGVSDMYI